MLLAIAGLSFLGLAAQNPSPEWGLMIANSKTFVLGAWWYGVFPGVVIGLVVLNTVLLGDRLAVQGHRLGKVLRGPRPACTLPGQPRPAAQDVSFAVGPAGSIGLVGESGSGKSTTAMAVARLLDRRRRSTVERLEFEGVDLTSLDNRRLAALRGRRMGFVFQDPSVRGTRRGG